jgi:Asp-tRNA(Asn)/Glu-tRNA(Gln) amidotransferase C subunit
MALRLIFRGDSAGSSYTTCPVVPVSGAVETSTGKAFTQCSSILHLLHKTHTLYNSEDQTMADKPASRRKPETRLRRDAVIETVKDAGLLSGARGRIAGRIRKQLVKAAKARSGIKSDTELLEYALARVALEDDFGQKLVARKGRIPRDIDLEF